MKWSYILALFTGIITNGYFYKLFEKNDYQAFLGLFLKNNQPISEVNKSLVKRKYGELLKPKYIHEPESRFPESCLTTQYKTHYNFIQLSICLADASTAPLEK